MVSVSASILTAELLVSLIAPQNLTGPFRIIDDRGLTLHEPDRVVQVEPDVVYRFDADGLRRFGDTPSGEGALDVLVLGDSYTFGWRLADDETYIGRLQETADARFGVGRIRFLNGGHSGWGTADYVSFLEHHADRLHPRAVLVFLNAFDVDRSLRRSRYVLDDATTLRLTERPIVRSPSQRFRGFGRSVPGYQWLLTHSHLTQLLRRTLIARAASRRPVSSVPPALELSPVRTSDTRLADALFVRLRDICRVRGYSLNVVTTGYLLANAPDMEYVSPAARAFFREANQFFAESGIRFADVSPRLDSLVGGDYTSVFLEGDPHPNGRGSQYVAQLTWPYLEAWLDALLLP